MASQNVSAAIVVHHKAAVPETHGASAPELLKIMRTTKGNVIGGMIVDGY